MKLKTLQNNMEGSGRNWKVENIRNIGIKNNKHIYNRKRQENILTPHQTTTLQVGTILTHRITY